MPAKNSFPTVTDMFCGAGGSSSGAKKAGASVIMAMNHWNLAIETHNTNHPEADHDCADISASNPRRYPSSDILIASPECTNHSLAKGKARKQQAQLNMFDGSKTPDPSEERSRATMWDVPRFAEYHDYSAIIVENVVDVRHWKMWDAWLHAMTLLGYDHQVVYLNSMFFWPTPQSRDRLYVVFWKAGDRRPDLDFRPLAYCPKCGDSIHAVQSWKNPQRKWGRYGARNQYVYCCPVCADIVEPYYYPAASAIDWTILGERVGDRKRPLKERTMERIRYGLKKFGRQQLTVQVDYTHSESNRARPITNALPTQTSRQVLALLSPFLMEYYSRNNAASGLEDALSTITTEPRHALIQPFVTSVNHSSDRARQVDEALPTQTSVNAPALVVPNPFFIKYYDALWNHTQGVDEPLSTILATDHHGLIRPPAFLTSYYYNREEAVSDIDQPIPTIPTEVRHALIQSPGFIAMLRNGNDASGFDEPLDTFTAGARHHALVQFMMSYYGQGGERPITDPMGTLTTRDRHAMVETADVDIDPADCLFRMLVPHEVKRGMAFDETYVILGNNRDQVKQAGNAVTPPVMDYLTRQVMAIFQ